MGDVAEAAEMTGKYKLSHFINALASNIPQTLAETVFILNNKLFFTEFFCIK